MNKLLLFVTVSVALGSCQNSSDNIENESWRALDGKRLMESKCFSCHNTQGTDNMLAPPMFRVKDHYWEEGITEASFIKAISEWVKNPIEENSVMPGARRKFGLMPKQEFDEAEVKAIAKYMYNNEI